MLNMTYIIYNIYSIRYYIMLLSFIVFDFMFYILIEGRFAAGTT